ncbi:hypothetical protein M8W91_002818 [Salmonella enterica]|nr:hypothetical protein [Salmonella enterica]EJF5856693.1 hypothetical protein [Salmonella enterica]EJF5948058.1 hypothetical protein [Salmonella enterica]EJF6158043.1 hypothetical protein [Salmonella enterica]EJF6377323.1 hypothetical protein [Salmonella enterica]
MRPSKNNTPPLRVTLVHIRQAGYCPQGARQFAQRYGLDFRQFIRDGFIDAEILLATGDELARRLVEFARQEELQNSHSGD